MAKEPKAESAPPATESKSEDKLKKTAFYDIKNPTKQQRVIYAGDFANQVAITVPPATGNGEDFKPGERTNIELMQVTADDLAQRKPGSDLIITKVAA